MLREPRAVEEFRTIAVAAVAQNRADDAVFRQRLRIARGGYNVERSGTADVKAFVVQEPLRHRDPGAIFDTNRVVERRVFEILGDALDADALDFGIAFGCELAGLHVRVDRRAHRIGRNGLDVWITRFECARNAAERSAGSARGDECGERRPERVPNLDAGRRFVNFAISRVVELIGPDRARRLFGDPPRDVIIVLIVRERNALHDAHIGAEDAQQRDLLGRLIVGDHDDRAITARCREQRDCNARCCRRSLRRSFHPA